MMLVRIAGNKPVSIPLISGLVTDSSLEGKQNLRPYVSIPLISGLVTDLTTSHTYRKDSDVSIPLISGLVTDHGCAKECGGTCTSQSL